MCSALMASAFFWSNRAGLELTSTTSNARDHLVEAENVAVLGDPPAQQGQVVQQTLGDEPAVAMQEQVGLRVSLGQLLGTLPQNRWQMGEFGNTVSHTNADSA